MNEEEIIILLVYIKIVLLALTAIGSLLYALPICFIRRFHTSVHFLSVNVSIALFICCSFWTIYFVLNTFYRNILWTEKSCLLILYLQTTVNCQVICALCVVSLNRLFAVVYRNKIYFRTKRWTITCITIQWILAGLLPLPHFASSLTHCFISGLELSHQIYVLFINGILPAIVLAVTNTIIFIFVRHSTQRVQAMNDENNTQHHTFNRRDIDLLKHMLFMFIVFFSGWIPIYIIAVVDWDGTGISYIAFHCVLILPALGFAIDAIDLFLYNHELRTYLIEKIRRRPNQ